MGRRGQDSTIEAFGGELDEAIGTAGGRCDRSPGFVQADDAAPGLEQTSRRHAGGEEVARAGDRRPRRGRPIVARQARSAARDQAIRQAANRRPGRTRRRRRPRSSRDRRRSSGRADRGRPRRSRAGRRPWRGPAGWGRCRRGSGRRPGSRRTARRRGPVGTPRYGQLGRQGMDRRAPHAGIDELAGLEALGVAPAPGGDRPAIHRDQVRRRRADVDQDRRARRAPAARRASARASQLAAAARSGRVADLLDGMELPVHPPDRDGSVRQGPRGRRRGRRGRRPAWSGSSRRARPSSSRPRTELGGKVAAIDCDRASQLVGTLPDLERDRAARARRRARP